MEIYKQRLYKQGLYIIEINKNLNIKIVYI